MNLSKHTYSVAKVDYRGAAAPKKVATSWPLSRHQYKHLLVREAAKKSSFLSGPALAPQSLGLVAIGTFFLTLKKKYFLSGTPV